MISKLMTTDCFAITAATPNAFLANILLDMKEKMLLPVRRSAGLEDNFYYNNCPESMNSCMKKEIDHQKKAASPGKSSKCSYAEFSGITHKFVGRQNVHRLLSATPHIHWHGRLG